MTVAFSVLALLLLIWLFTGYKGWTWIPIGKIPGKKQEKIACVGDSITYGLTVCNWFKYNYPHVLGKMLGKKACVHNYGYSSRTALTDGDYPFVNTIRYKRSLSFNPDLVILKFGTNDSKTNNWKGEDGFEKDYECLMLSYLSLPSHPKMILLTPATPYVPEGNKPEEYSFNIQKSEIEKINNIVRKLAKKYSTGYIDIFEYTGGHRDWFSSDGIHPNATGSRMIAQKVFEYIMEG